MTRAVVPFGCFLVLVAWAVAGLVPARGAEPPAGGGRHFDAHIAPLLARHCMECHDAAFRQGGLDLSRKAAGLAGGDSGAAIVPGNAADSLLWQYVEAELMPPDDRPRLSPEQKELLRQWIDAGAHWSAETIDPLAVTRDRRAVENWVLRLTVPEYIETVRSAVGVDVEQDARRILPPDLRADGFSNTAYNLNVDLGHVEAYAELSEIIVRRMDVVAFAAEFSQRRDLSERSMRELISAMGKWLLRGPLDEREISAFLRISTAVADARGNYAEAVGYLVQAMLQSPRFIYRIERQPADPTPRPVGDYELASRLSYTVWGGPPDKELMRAADAGELRDGRRVEAQVRRMLQDPRAVTRSSRFIYEWMDLERLGNLRPDPNRFPGWNDRLAADMRDETLAFFHDVVWEQKRPMWDLMNAQVTFATPRLAAHYGLQPGGVPVERDLPNLAPTPGRVTNGLQTLYTFQEGSGDVVRDVSNAGEAIPLKIADPAAVRWSGDGLVIGQSGGRSSTLIASERPPARLIDAIRASGAITLEAWVTPANASQTGPARIVTLSSDTSARNFTLGQTGDRFETRLRTSATSPNGEPSLSSTSGTAGANRIHVVYTRASSGEAALYVNGRESGRRQIGGSLSNWDRGFRLALANELSNDRPWQGTLHLVAVYDRPLSAAEVRRNHDAGTRLDAPSAPLQTAAGAARIPDLQALYRFDEGGGDTVRDRSGAGEPLDLKIANPAAVKWGEGQLAVNASTSIASAAPPKRLIDAVKKSRQLTLEAWIAPAATNQSGPARILTLSSGSTQRNFTLGQDGDKYDARLRASRSDNNGMPSLSSPSGAVQSRLSHVVYTRDASGKATLYVDGQPRGTRDVGGDLSNWDDGFRLALANESTGDRAWRGVYHQVAIYSRALTADEVRSSHGRAPSSPTLAARGGGLARADLPSALGRPQALYTFREGGGDVVRDVSNAGEPLDLKIANSSAVQWGAGHLAVNASTRIASAAPPKRLIDAVKQSRALSLEAWLAPADRNQSGPARILTLSSGTNERNFTLGQDGDKYDARLRTRSTNINGMPGLSSPSGSVQNRLTHVVYTRDAAGKATLYVDGQPQGTRDVGGDLSNWNDGFHLALANESTGDRAWRGTFHRIAIYSRALSAEEVRSNYGLAPSSEAIASPGDGLARYDVSSVPGRGGLLTQGSALTIGGDEASMVARGLFILHDFLYSAVGNAPPGVDTTPVPTKPGLSQRAIAEVRLADQSCTGCHSRFEPLAFGLEKFDGIGAYFERDQHGNRLRDDGEILFPGQEGPISYQSSAELMDLLAESDRVRMNMTRKVTQFALGRPLVESDARVLDQIHQAALEGGGTYASLITAIVMSDLVQMTRTETNQ